VSGGRAALIRPSEIWQINSENAEFYHFDSEKGNLGIEQANLQLLELGCKLVTIKWTTNHWCMILWKLAGIVQAQPKQYDALWQYGEVIKQLCYR
jgi:breast cancer 2 susceptibility protein